MDVKTPLLNTRLLEDYRSELQAFLAINGDPKEQDKEKRAVEIQTQKLKLESCFMRLLEVALKEDAEVWRELGRAYFYGYGVDKNLEQSASWYQLAANAGDAKAMVGLALCLDRDDQGGNLTAAAKWYRKAAELGDSDALRYLALAYSSGRGVPVDTKLADQLILRWYNSADR
jgi:TPR repeat protein